MTSKQQEGNNQFGAFNEQLGIWPLCQCRIATRWLNITPVIVAFGGSHEQPGESAHRNLTWAARSVCAVNSCLRPRLPPRDGGNSNVTQGEDAEFNEFNYYSCRWTERSALVALWFIRTWSGLFVLIWSQGAGKQRPRCLSWRTLTRCMTETVTQTWSRVWHPVLDILLYCSPVHSSCPAL